MEWQNFAVCEEHTLHMVSKQFKGFEFAVY
jgi:hypothetical protein